MRGWITCKHCKGIGKIYKWWIFSKKCPYCNGLGDIWVDNIDEYFKSNKQEQIIYNYLNFSQILTQNIWLFEIIELYLQTETTMGQFKWQNAIEVVPMTMDNTAET